MTHEQAMKRLRYQLEDRRNRERQYAESFCSDDLKRIARENTDALALAIRALELVREVAACPWRWSDGDIHGSELRVMPEVPRTTWDALRALAAEGGR
jgi:hypothetical protein